MPIAGAAIGAIGSIAGGLIGSSSAKKAAKIQESSNNAAIASQEKMLGMQLDQTRPYVDAGSSAQNRLMTLLGIGGDKGAADYGSAAKSFGMSDFQTDPGYQFRQDQASQALQRSAAARGGLISGSAMKALETYSQNIASEEYSNAFNRFQTERQAKLSPLQTMAGIGANAASGNASAIANASQGIAGNITGAGEAAASGIVGSSNALAGALSSAASYGQNYFNNQNAMNLISTLNNAKAKTAAPASQYVGQSRAIPPQGY